MSVISTLPLDRLQAAHDAWHSTYADQAGEAQKVAHHQITAGIAAAGGTCECAFTDPLVVDRAEGLSTEPDTYDEDLPVEVVAALRQAWDAGVPLVDVASVLGPQGYEIRVLPCEPMDDAEDQFASLAGIDYDDAEEPEGDDEDVLNGLASRLMDVLALSKGYSFEAENRLIARNKKRRGSKEPHPFKASRYATRDGRVRCMMCGGPEPEKGTMCGVAATATAKAETYSPPAGVREAARRALDWIKEGKAGSNFTDVGRARAAQLARGDSVSRETIGRMRSYFARHEVDRQAEGFSSGEDGFPSPGRVAWDAWGGDPGRSWVNGLWERLEKSDIEGTYDPEDALNIRQKALYEAYEAIAEALGPWDGGIGAEGAHYIPADSNPFAEAGMKCANCVFFDGGGGCEILSMPVEPQAACKLWIIPEHLLSEEAEKAIGPHSYRKADDGENCSVCGQASDNWRHAAVGKAAFVQKADERRYTMGPMYVPNMVDAHGEWTDPDELQKAVWDYVRAGDRRIRLQHNRSVVAGEWVEVLAWPYEVTVPMFGADMEGRKLTYPANTVFLGVVWEPWAWELVKAGKLRGYSIGGKADRVLADLPEAGE